ncbi:MAG: Rieske (2Fe-2S) protein [Candidatus Eremiobacteraeota bacterium]|nr:Rieske (2Fe-2S) protein [Candidatus Eremiobacteraeota bacterium]
MPNFLPVATIGEIPPGSSRIFVVDRREIAVFNVGGSLYAIDNVCPHQGGPLGEGWLDGTLVSCPWHGWCFDVRTGKMTLGDFAMVDRFAVRLEGETVYVASEPLRDEGSQ